MIKFFRKIRQNLLSEGKTGKYLKYAIGEIILVVIGILIALQINNWNEQQKQVQDLHSHFKALLIDLNLDIEMLKIRQNQAQNNYMYSDSLINYIRHKTFDELSNLELYVLHPKITYRPFEWHGTTIDEMKFTGTFRYIKNKKIVNLLFEYESNKVLSSKWQDTDESKLTTTYTYWNDIVNRNYSGQWNRLSLVEWDGNGNKVFRNYSEDPVYKQMKDENLELLTNDLKKIYKGANFVWELKNGLKFRFEGSIPNMIERAEELKTIITQELDITKG
ncbi:DUF6090 family protein [Muriicola sp.]|uniref:DUF6090 family protein n=1 Tax=Muriicola sp. TaxID=2020856 RepID=UPI003C760005